MKSVLLAFYCALLGSSSCSPGHDAHPSPSRFLGADVEYTLDGSVLQGYVSIPSNSDSKGPVVVIVHDWNGIDSYEKGRADQLADMGYVAFCVDIYGKGVRPKNAQESAAEAGKYYADNALLRKRAKAGLEKALANPSANGSAVAIGYCFGGMTVLEMARAGMNVRGVVSFHGSLTTKSPLKRGVFPGSILVLHGADDPYVPQKDVDALKAEMAAATAKFEFVPYPGAVHSFTVPSPDGGTDGAKYNKEADAKSWDALKAFLKRTVG